MAKDKLKKYRHKRNLKITPEPVGKKKKSSAKPIFVIQKHDASNLHYDFRLEINGVLKSWAVTKGLSTDPKERRLAMATEDHPLDYANFEGFIPEDEYGGGTVIVWDTGRYKNLRADKADDDKNMQQSYEDGKIEVFLYGKKLTGGYALIKTGSDNRWMLIKMKGKHADARRNPVSTQPKSVKSGKTIKQIAKNNG